MSSIINATTTAGVTVTGDNSGSLQLATNNGTTALTIDTSQNVGIGTSSPTVKLDVTGNLKVTNSSGSTIVANRTSNPGSLELQHSGVQTAQFSAISGGGVATFTGSTPTERMRIIATGQVGINVIPSPSNTFNVVNISGDNVCYFRNAVGTGVYLQDGQSSWSSASDERIKDIIEPITGSAEKLSTLRTIIGKFKTDAEGVRRPFLIAQDVEKILPEAVNTTPNGDMGLNYVDLIPLLVNAIKELNEKTEAQALEIQALKGTL